MNAGAGSLRLRLLIAGALSILLALALAAAGLTLLFRHHVERRVDTELAVYLDQLAAKLERAPTGEIRVDPPPSDPRFSKPLSGLYWQVALEGSGKLLRSRSLWDAELPLPPGAPAEVGARHERISGPGEAPLYVLERRVDLPARLGGGAARLAVALDAGEVDAATWRFVTELAPFLALIAALLIAAAWAQVTVGLKPLSAIRARLAAIRSGSAERLGEDFPQEIRPLAAEIDALLEARGREVEKARARAQDLAHGLRTPLQVLNTEVSRLNEKGEIESAIEIATLAETMRRHVERELARVRLASAARPAKADVATAIDRVARVVKRTPAGERLDWTVDVPQALAARIDADDLSEALGNLLENAARYALSRVTVSARELADGVAIMVADDGPGIPEQRRAEALARGQRLDAKGPGAGLGLAIVSDIAEAWNGTLTLGDAAPGLEARLTLPRA